jgi:DnaJ-class molecular chaperone
MKQKKEIPEGMKECGVCNGKGEALFSCCTGERVDEDYGRCPTCKEGLGESKCEECEGTGFVALDVEQDTHIVDPIGQSELYHENQIGL